MQLGITLPITRTVHFRPEVLIVVGVVSAAGEPLRSDADIHLANLEPRRGHWRGSVAAECFWTIEFHFQDPRWNIQG
jgi:hypothetical protein